MNIYNVKIAVNTVIAAHSESEAIKHAEKLVYDLGEASAKVVARIQKTTDLPEAWTGLCRPFGDRDPNDRTIRFMLSHPLDRIGKTDTSGA